MGLVGREHEVAQSLVALRSGRSVVVEGDPGIGKSCVLDELARQLRNDGDDVELVRATWAARRLAFAPFSHLDHDGPASQQPGEHLSRLSNEILGRVEAGRFALLIDDAHALDEFSVTLVHQLATRGCRLVLSYRGDPGLPIDLDRMRDAGGFDTVRLAALSPTAISALLTDRLDGPVEDAVTTEIGRLSGGHPLFVNELINEGCEEGVIRERDGVWSLARPPGTTIRLRELIEARLRSVDDGAWSLLKTIAVAGPVPLEVLDDEDRECVARLEAAELARLIQEPLRLVVQVAHDLHTEVILAGGELPLHRARNRAIDLLETVWVGREPDDLIRAAGLRMAIRRFDHDALVLAAELCLERFDAHSALAFAEGALVDRQSADARLVRAAALSGCGRRSEANEEFRSLTSTAHGPDARARAVLRHAYDAFLRQGDLELAVGLLNDVIRDGPPDSIGEARGLLATAFTYGGRYAQALEVCSPLLDSEQGIPPAAAQGLMTCLSVMGRPVEALAAWRRLADPRRDDIRVEPGDAVVVLSVMRLMSQWQLGVSLDGAHPLDWASRRSYAVVRSPIVRAAMTATADVLRGHLGDAAASFRDVDHALSLLPAPYFAFTNVLATIAHAGVGDIDEAERSLARVESMPLEPRQGSAFWTSRAHIAVHVARGDTALGVQMSLELAERHSAERFHAVVALHDVVRFGAPELAVSSLNELADEVPGHVVGTDQRRSCRCRGREGRGRPDAGGRRLHVAGLDLLALEAASEASRLLSERSSPMRAEALRARIATLFERCGPVTTPAVRDVPRTLTDRELVVARLAASGASNKEIAIRLGTSVRTVGNQLQSVYSKLGISGRSGLEGLT